MNNKGFTLLEMVVTVGILGILMSAIAIIFPNWLRQYTMLKETAAATEIMDVVASGIQDELSVSQEREWSEDGLYYINGDRIGNLPLEDSPCSIAYTDKKLVIEGQPGIYGAVFDTGFYKDMSVKITLEEEKRSRDDAIFLLSTIEVYSSDGTMLGSETKSTYYYNPEPLEEEGSTD